jgi:hypothetical protein
MFTFDNSCRWQLRCARSFTLQETGEQQPGAKSVELTRTPNSVASDSFRERELKG